MNAESIFTQNDGNVTKRYYLELAACGHAGELAVALFRCQKRSSAAKSYRGRNFKAEAYEVKNWSLSEICRLLQKDNLGMVWGWARDEKAINFEWVLYCDLPTGQVSFHSADRLNGPNYPKEWDGFHLSKQRIVRFCDSVMAAEYQRREDFGPNGDATTPGFFKAPDTPTEFSERTTIELSLGCRRCGAAAGEPCKMADNERGSTHMPRVNDARRLYEWNKSVEKSQKAQP
jgi:hypothetical protein